MKISLHLLLLAVSAIVSQAVAQKKDWCVPTGSRCRNGYECCEGNTCLGFPPFIRPRPPDWTWTGTCTGQSREPECIPLDEWGCESSSDCCDDGKCWQYGDTPDNWQCRVPDVCPKLGEVCSMYMNCCDENHVCDLVCKEKHTQEECVPAGQDTDSCNKCCGDCKRLPYEYCHSWKCFKYHCTETVEPQCIPLNGRGCQSSSDCCDGGKCWRYGDVVNDWQCRAPDECPKLGQVCSEEVKCCDENHVCKMENPLYGSFCEEKHTEECIALNVVGCRSSSDCCNDHNAFTPVCIGSVFGQFGVCRQPNQCQQIGQSCQDASDCCGDGVCKTQWYHGELGSMPSYSNTCTRCLQIDEMCDVDEDCCDGFCDDYAIGPPTCQSWALEPRSALRTQSPAPGLTRNDLAYRLMSMNWGSNPYAYRTAAPQPRSRISPDFYNWGRLGRFF